MTDTCKCQSPPFDSDNYKTVMLGEDAIGADVSLETCKACGLIWLNYLIEEPERSRSGRWWLVTVPPTEVETLTAKNARSFIQQQKAGFVGGSHFNSRGKRIFAPIHVH